MAFIYRVHAVERMFQRDISEGEVQDIVLLGEIIEEYIDDRPYPSFLSLGYVGTRAIHVVFAKDDKENYIIITAYEPDMTKWENDYKTRK